MRVSRRVLLPLAGLSALGLGLHAASAGYSPVAAAKAGWVATHGAAPVATPGKGIAPVTPKAVCGKGALPETGVQGRVPAADYTSGRAAKGYQCNAVQTAHLGTTGGFKTFRYTDRSGRVCAFYDGTLLFPTATYHGEAGGVHVLDMSDPARPVETSRLLTAAMDSPHESLALNPLRGLLAAGMGSPGTAPGVVDVYDVSTDCRYPVLRSTSPLGILGHESGFSPDGRTLWISTTAQPGVTAIDVSNPALPSIVWRSAELTFHGMSLSDDGNRLYGADLGSTKGLAILDVSQVQARVANPVVTQVSHLSWDQVSIPQNSIPVTIKGKKYLVEFDEYASGDQVGAGRVIDISDEKKPRVVSDLRLAVHQAAARTGTDQQKDPGAGLFVQDYAAHYCGVPQEVEPGIVACSMIASGLRVFDISDPAKPREVAYFNKPAPNTLPLVSGAYAMSQPSFDKARKEVWYADGDSGFYVVKLTNGAWK